MKIKNDIYFQLINNTPAAPPESGGIIGGKNHIVTDYVLDIHGERNLYSYKPNIKYLNQAITMWNKKGIAFYGMYHSHVAHGYHLSPADKEYMKRLTLHFSESANGLYFPIVLPNDRMICYSCKVRDDRVVFLQENITLVK